MRALLIAADGTTKEKEIPYPPKPLVRAIRRTTKYPAYIGEGDEIPAKATVRQNRIFVLVRDTFAPKRDQDLAIYVEQFCGA